MFINLIKNMNFLNFIFVNFTITVLIFGGLLNFCEPILPAFISQFFRYGKHAYKGHQNPLIQIVELPKAYFKHFYAFALLWSYWGFYLILKTIIMSTPVPEGILVFFDLIAGGERRPVLIDSTSALIAITLFCIQCTRRCYESWSMQIFSKSKINLSHYMVGYFHYFAAIAAILANTEGFVRGSAPSNFSLSKITLAKFVYAGLFHIAWNQQFQANKILVNLRIGRDGQVDTEKHLMPKGGGFEYVSSPHMFSEVIMYILIWGIIPNSVTWFYCVIWVIVNQTQNAWFTHKWYLEKFPNYPKNRRAIYPYLL